MQFTAIYMDITHLYPSSDALFHFQQYQLTILKLQNVKVNLQLLEAWPHVTI